MSTIQRLGLAGVSTLGILTLVLAQSRARGTTEWQAACEDVEQLQALEARLDAEVLEIQIGRSHDYDLLVYNVTAARRKLQDLKRGRKGSDPVLGAVLSAEDTLVAEVAELDSFKRRSAILRNSVSYFPRAARALVDQTPATSPVHAAANSLLRDVLAFNLLGDPALGEDVARARVELARLAQHQPRNVQDIIEIVLLHAYTITTYRAQVDRSLAAIVDPALAPDYRAIRRALDDARLEEEGRVGRWRLLLYGLSLALVLAISYTVWRLLRSGRDLRDANVTLLAQQADLAAARDHVERLNADLERKVVERTAELETTHTRLVHVARRAGMADVAIGVLHNVGNVLNSLNVSAAVILDRLRGSQTPALLRVGAMLEDHEGDLGAFLTTDPRGRKLPTYMNRLVGRVQEDEQELLAEVRSLLRSVEHVRRIVGEQQVHSRGAADMRADVEPAELMEEALRMALPVPDAELIHVERRYDVLPAASIDRHTTLQILVNLIRNARDALASSERSSRRIVLALSRGPEGTGGLQFAVADDGAGIASENLPRLFQQGFTTKMDGHGFGLHNAAVAAQNMGGSLCARSDGPGAGATFILELPASGASAMPDR